MEEKPYSTIDQLFKRYQLSNMHFIANAKPKWIFYVQIIADILHSTAIILIANIQIRNINFVGTLNFKG